MVKFGDRWDLKFFSSIAELEKLHLAISCNLMLQTTHLTFNILSDCTSLNSSQIYQKFDCNASQYVV